jgi:hypothetical protein
MVIKENESDELVKAKKLLQKSQAQLLNSD